jgi:hypothetical protein
MINNTDLDVIMMKQTFEILQHMYDVVVKENNLYYQFDRDENWPNQDVIYLENERYIQYIGKSKYLLSETGYKVAEEFKKDNKKTKKTKEKVDK